MVHEFAVSPDLTDTKVRRLLLAMFAAAVSAADPLKLLGHYLPRPPKGKCIVVGAGKASAAMVVALEQAWPGVPITGAVVTPYGHALPTSRVEVLEAGHPVPDSHGVAAARRMMDAVRDLTEHDLVLALISGGGSSLLCLPAEGLSLGDKQAVNRLLLKSGLDIRTINVVRRRLSRIKGGKLAEAAAPAQVVTLAMSDVPGDDPAAIASGPTIPDPSWDEDLGALISRLGPDLPPAAHKLLLQRGTAPPSLIPDFRLIGSPLLALDAAAQVGRLAGFDVIILGAAIEGEAKEVGISMASFRPVQRPTILLSGGETTVTFDAGSAGRGGRNTELLLALACALGGRPNTWALAADTDGQDGTGIEAAGAIVTPETLKRGRDSGLDPEAYLARHDTGTYFECLGDLVVTGPTFTNVNDFRAVLIAGPPNE